MSLPYHRNDLLTHLFSEGGASAAGRRRRIGTTFPTPPLDIQEYLLSCGNLLRALRKKCNSVFYHPLREKKKKEDDQEEEEKTRQETKEQSLIDLQ